MKFIGTLLLAGGVLVAATAKAESDTALSTSPGFASCSYYLNRDSNTDAAAITVEYRKKGTGHWLEALPPVSAVKAYALRGTIVNLQEASNYELRLKAQGKILASTGFTTMGAAVPVGRTIDLAAMKKPIKISLKGRPDSWIKYTVKPGTVIDGDGLTGTSGIEIAGAEYVIIEGIKLKGGRIHGIYLHDSRNVRIVNCDISSWGRPGTRGHDPEVYIDEKGGPLHDDCGIYVTNCKNTVIERNFIHDPRMNSTSWQYGHPIGSYAIRAGKLRGTVIRYNDFVGTDERRWCDVIGSIGNSDDNGGLYQDAEIYGNFLAFPHDDGIELDGGEVNMRVFRNRIEGGYCGISTTPCIYGPSYVYNNLFISRGDADGNSGHGIKDLRASGGAVFYINNTVIWPNHGIRIQPDPRLILNNVFDCSESVAGLVEGDKNHNIGRMKGNIFYAEMARKKDRKTYNQFNFWSKPEFVNVADGQYALKKRYDRAMSGVKVPGFNDSGYIGMLPPGSRSSVMQRDTGFAIDKNSISFPGSLIEQGKLNAEVNLAASADGKPLHLEICKNDSFAWLEVSPRKFSVIPGRKVRLKVSIKPELFLRPGLHSGAFIIRRQDGLSLPVSVYAVKPGSIPMVKLPSEALVIPAVETANKFTGKISDTEQGKAITITKKDGATYKFNIARSGNYYILVHCYAAYPASAHNDFAFSLDGAEFVKVRRKIGSNRWSWTGLSNGKKRFWIGGTIRFFKLNAGEHVFKLKGVDTVTFDKVVITPAFEFPPGNADNFKL